MTLETKSILWADDDFEQFNTGSKTLEVFLLEHQIRADIHNAIDGQDLFARLSLQHQPDVLVVDVDMPRMGGLDIVPEIYKRWPGLPIVVVSGHVRDDNVRPVLQNLFESGVIFAFHGPEQRKEFCSSILDAISRKWPCILHISDLHFGKMHAFASRQLTELLELLVREVLKDGGVDLIVASGDFACIGLEEEFAEAKSFLSTLTLALGLDLSCVFIVPGNHDIDRHSAPNKRFANFLDFFFDLYSESRSPNEVFASFPELYDSHRRTIRPGIRSLGGDSLHFCRHLDEFRTSVFGFNSVCSEDAEWDLGRISAHQFIAATQEVSSLALPRRKYFRVATFHHNLFVVPSFRNDGEPERVVRNPSFVLHQLMSMGVEIVLHGHTHYSMAHSYKPIDLEGNQVLRPLYVIATGTLGARDREPSQPFAHVASIRLKGMPGGSCSSALVTLFQLWDNAIQWRRGPTRLIEFKSAPADDVPRSQKATTATT